MHLFSYEKALNFNRLDASVATVWVAAAERLSITKCLPNLCKQLECEAERTASGGRRDLNRGYRHSGGQTGRLLGLEGVLNSSCAYLRGQTNSALDGAVEIRRRRFRVWILVGLVGILKGKGKDVRRLVGFTGEESAFERVVFTGRAGPS